MDSVVGQFKVFGKCGITATKKKNFLKERTKVHPYHKWVKLREIHDPISRQPAKLRKLICVHLLIKPRRKQKETTALLPTKQTS